MPTALSWGDTPKNTTCWWFKEAIYSPINLPALISSTLIKFTLSWLCPVKMMGILAWLINFRWLSLILMESTIIPSTPCWINWEILSSSFCEFNSLIKIKAWYPICCKIILKPVNNLPAEKESKRGMTMPINLLCLVFKRLAKKLDL